MSYGAGVALGAAIEYVLGIGEKAILDHNLALAGRLMAGLDQLGAELLTPREDAMRAGIVSARLPGRDSQTVTAELIRAGVIVSPRFGATRFSVHFFNDESDVDRALAAVEHVARGTRTG